jgi:nickel-dependent lactate racemase
LRRRRFPLTFRLRYGGTYLSFKLPKGFKPALAAAGRVKGPGMDARGAVQVALEEPIDGVRLRRLAGPGVKAALIVDDLTRPTPVAAFADLLLKELEGVEELSVVMALGLHPPPSRGEVEAKLGRELAEMVVFHDPRGDLTYLGRTVNGTEVYINRTVAEADLRVAVGTITPHPFAGFSGGPKILLPGVAGEETIKANHGLMRRPGATLASLDGNPVYDDEAYVASKLFTYALNLIPSPGGGYLGAVAGEALKAHRAGAAKLLEHCLYVVPRPVDIAITSSHPAEVNLYQSWKGVFAVADAVKPGGTIILATPAPMGVPEEKLKVAERYGLASKSIGELEDLLSQLPDYVFGLIYLKLRAVLEGKQLIVVSPSLSREEVEELGFMHARSIEEALEMVRREGGEVLINDAGAEAVVKVGAS